MRVLVCGGRDFTDRKMFVEAMEPIREGQRWGYDPCGKSDKDHLEIISGGAKGADSLAIEYAKAFSLPLQVFEADWENQGSFAGPARNKRMLDEGKPDIVIAFPGGRGTADMVRKARKAGVEVIEIA